MGATITWMGHATFRLVLPDERVIFIDPWLAENPACPDNLKVPSRCDMILLTHGHFDHVADVGTLIEAFDPTIVGNFDLCAVLQKRLGKGKHLLCIDATGPECDLFRAGDHKSLPFFYSTNKISRLKHRPGSARIQPRRPPAEDFRI